MHILLVEDNPADARLLREAMDDGAQFAGDQPLFDLHWVASGEQALQFLRRATAYATAPTPDLVLLDLNLPGLHGHEVLAAIKGDAALAAIPVVVLSSSAARHDVSQAYAAHANAYMLKPVDYEQCLALVAAIRCYWFGAALLPASGR